MTPFHVSTDGSAGHRSGSPFFTRRQTHSPSCKSVSDEDPLRRGASQPSEPPAESSDASHASPGTVLSRFHLGRHGANEQPPPAPTPCQTEAGVAEPPPIETEPEFSFFPQETIQNSDTETVHPELALLVDRLASPGTRASTRSSEDSSTDSHEDDANSDYTELISDDEGDTNDEHQHVVLGAHNPSLKRSQFFFGTGDTGAAVSLLSNAKARLVAPYGISDDFAKVGTRTLHILGSEVVVHGPIWVKFWLRNKRSRTRYLAPFYVLPIHYAKSGFDALLNIKVVQRLGLVEIQRDLTAENDGAEMREEL